METFPRPRHDGGMIETIDAATIPARLREGFRRFYIRAFARRGVILGTHFVDYSYTPPRTREVRVKRPDGKAGSFKGDALPIWAAQSADECQSRAEALTLNPATRGRAWVYAVAGWRRIRQDIDEGGKGKRRQPLPHELDAAIGARPDRVRMPSEMPDPAYMEAGAATPLIRAERIRAADAARAVILDAAERTAGGQSAARILLGNATWMGEAAARDVTERRIRTDLDIVSRLAATAALAANCQD